MHLHEYLAKGLLAKHGVLIPSGSVAANASEAEAAARRMQRPRFAVKAQIYGGDRMANGGIRLTDSPEGVRAAAADMIGKRLVTRQTGPLGEVVRRVYVEEAVDISAALFVAVVLDRSAGSVVLLARNPAVGAKESDDATRVERLPIHLCSVPVADFTGLAQKLVPDAEIAAKLAAFFEAIVAMLVELDATMVEINPLAITPDGRLVALHVKITIDNHALFRHPELAAIRETAVTEDGDPRELDADRRHINYIAMDGNIGVAVNGAGLALATLDMLVDAGGRPANFMDVRTTAVSLDIAFGFDLLLANPALRAILLNVHGGGMQRCDTIVEGMAISMRRMGRMPPLAVRLAGNNADFARERLKAFGIKFVECANIAEAVTQVVVLAKKGGA